MKTINRCPALAGALLMLGAAHDGHAAHALSPDWSATVIEPGVDTNLVLTRDARGLEVRAYVVSAPPRRLRWKLVSVARSGGGTSSVSQSGTVDAGSDAPVSVSVFSPGSTGTATLTIFDGEDEIAREQIEIGPQIAVSPGSPTG